MRYIYRILIVLVAFIILGSVLFSILNKGLTNYSENTTNKFYEMFVDTKRYDVLLLGTSRTYQNIDVKICDSISHKTFYNLGIGGAGGFEIVTVFKGFLNTHPTPRNVVLNFDRNVLDISRGFHNPIYYFNSLDNDVIYDAFREKDYPVWFYKNIPFSRMIEFNDDIRNNCFRGLMGKKDIEVKQYHGFLPNYEKIGKFDTVYKTPTMIGHDAENFKYLDTIVEICRIKDINLILITSPAYKDHFYKRHLDYQLIMNKISSEYVKAKNIPIFYFDRLPINYDNRNFSDNIHLNRSGTTIFSKLLINSIKMSLK